MRVIEQREPAACSLACLPFLIDSKAGAVVILPARAMAPEYPMALDDSPRQPGASPVDSTHTTAPPMSPIQIFLIADVRGYTRFTLEHGDEAAARLATRFAALTRTAIEAR